MHTTPAHGSDRLVCRGLRSCPPAFSSRSAARVPRTPGAILPSRRLAATPLPDERPASASDVRIQRPRCWPPLLKLSRSASGRRSRPLLPGRSRQVIRTRRRRRPLGATSRPLSCLRTKPPRVVAVHSPAPSALLGGRLVLFRPGPERPQPASQPASRPLAEGARRRVAVGSSSPAGTSLAWHGGAWHPSQRRRDG